MVLVLRDMEGFSDEEVAEITGLRSGTVRVRLHRARLVRKELMKAVKPRGGKAAAASRASAPAQPSRCKAMFAELSDYLDDKLDHPLRQELKRHLKGCQPCQALLASLKATVEQCRRSPVEGLNRKRTARLRTKVPADYERMIAKAAAVSHGLPRASHPTGSRQPSVFSRQPIPDVDRGF
jgi:RNA polymerase sigma-70 factor (ECF subfamily)